MAQNKQFKAEHGDAFNADAVTIMHGEGKIVVDFKQTTPRLDQAGDDAQHTVITEHDAVVLRPQMAKALLQLLEENLSNYEDQYGEIEMPDTDTGAETAETEDHSYIG